MTDLRHFLDIDRLDRTTLRSILDQAACFKRGTAGTDEPLKGKTIVLIFEKPSTRTRVSFEVGMVQLGGNVVVLSEKDSQLGRGETPADTARVLSRYADLMMIRTDSHQKLLDLANFATVPVINGLTDDSHPCQIMADIQTFEEHRGSIEGKTVTWVGDGNNVAASWLHAAVKLGFEFRIATPPELSLGQDLLDWAAREGGTVKSFTDAQEAVAGSDCVVTDTWVSMGDDGERAQRLDLLAPYQVNANVMTGAKTDAIFMHCLPAHRGEEVTDEVLDGPQSVVWDEVENRLHAQKAVMAWCLGVA
ncbi:MAG: ornithine carbamoyltransferase [Rhodospirillaceae bacterium TMED167]|nr:ornithine carbamoyltransferase [Rhodospirillaceae bacterium]OUW25412.1 MAG: ornithine carbamoyltransferase [Rhodospirillaceae bacterium TMED167]